jgi:pimeloyl-ACP methyl ester carboxylesterase
MLIATLLASALASLSIASAVLGHRAIQQRRVARRLQVSDPAGIDEEVFVRLGGIEQWISIRGRNRGNPVIVLLHGGPGCSYSIFTPRLVAWEEHFTLVQWDQRGAGKTFGRNGAAGCGPIAMERMIEDAIELVEHLRTRLGQRKVVVLSSSMGTLIGLPLVKRRPDLVSAYVATDLNVGLWNDRQAHEATIERLRRAGLPSLADRLGKLGPDPAKWTAKQWSSSGQWVTRSEPQQNRSIMRLLLGSMWFSPRHSLADLRHLTAGMSFTADRLFPEFLSFDARALGLDLEVPFFVFQGARDIHTPTHLALAYFDEVRAPLKVCKLIEEAGHFAAFLQPERFLDHLLAEVRPVLAPARDIAA